MSSRALRKAQKEREKLELQKQADDGSQGSDEEPEITRAPARQSAFALLNENDDAEDADDSLENPDVKATQSTDDEEAQDSTTSGAIARQPASKRKKKKKKGKNKDTATGSTGTPSAAKSADIDEIDIALKALATTAGGGGISQQLASTADSATVEVCQLLSIDTHHLHVANEMKRLFGRAAFAVDREEETAAAPSREQLSEGLSLSEAVKGKYCPGGAGLPAVLRRRNPFISGKEDWPRATGGGLAMEVVQNRPGGIVEYRFVHNQAYQSTQHEFEMCVMSMNPSTMVRLLQVYPYHVSTLLQVSEISKHEKDYATSGDLLERALFSFGRAVHSTFAANLAQGKARLDFRRAENREFWLACWKYIGNISMRATWRTAYEWARLLLSLDPDNDPYCVSLLIDQLALRAKQSEGFENLCASKFFKTRWATLANIQFSRGLASKNLSNNSEESSKILGRTIERFPWVAARLLQEVDVGHLPKQIWGKTAQTPADILHSELYIATAKDLWKSPESAAFLAKAASSSRETSGDPTRADDITRNEARFVILTDKPALIGLVPRELTAALDNAADPLPPEDSIYSYDAGRSRGRTTLAENLEGRTEPAELLRNNPQQFIEEINTFQTFFELLVPGFTRATAAARSQAAEDADDDDESALSRGLANLEITDDSVDEAIARSNLTVQEMRLCLARLVELRTALVAQPGLSVRSPSGDEVTMMPNGLLRARLRSGRGTGDAARVQAGPGGARPRPEVHDDEELARMLMEEELNEMEGGGEMPPLVD